LGLGLGVSGAAKKLAPSAESMVASSVFLAKVQSVRQQ